MPAYIAVNVWILVAAMSARVLMTGPAHIEPACGISSTANAPAHKAELQELRHSTKPEALYRLGLAHAVGTIITKDCQSAEELMQQAAALHYAKAQNALGELLESGLGGVAQDLHLAAKSYRSAADQGDATAEYNLGRLIAADHGYEFSGSPTANSQMAWAFADDLHSAGRATPSSDDERFAIAAIWWQRSSRAGNASAAYELGALYADGRGVPRDLDRAQRLYRIAAQARVPGAQQRLDSLPKN